MNDQSKEKGYALIIVLFAIVFITVITAVFLRGALSNAIQEKTLDENNLVVVSAESGTDYYTWELKQVYDEDLLEAKFTQLVNEAIAAKESPINYVNIQNKIATDFHKELSNRANSLKGEGAAELFSDYTHKLIVADVGRTELDGDIFLTMKGTVEGELLKTAELQKKKKELKFELIFVIPKVQTADGSIPTDPDGTTSPGGSLVTMPTLKNPKTPASPTAPADVVGISKPAKICPSSTGNIANQNCYLTRKHEENYSINKSTLLVEDYLTSWGTVSMQNSFINIKNKLEVKDLKFEDTEIVIGDNLKGNNSTIINGSKVKAKTFDYSADLRISNSDVIVATGITSGKNHIQNSIIKTNSFNGGFTTFNGVHLIVANLLEVQTANIENSIISANSYKANAKAEFNKTDVKISTTYNSGGANFTNSNLEVGSKLDTGGGLFYVEGSNVKIVGDAHTANGSTIKNSVMNIGGYFLHTSKPLDAESSDIFVGGKLTATNGTNLYQVNMNVLGDYESSTAFKLAKTNLNIAGNLSLSNGGTVNNSLMIASRITASTPLVLNGSVVSAGYLQSDIMTLNNSKVCAKDFNVRSLMMDDDSKIYYSNTSNHTKNNIIKLSSVDFEKTCGMNSSATPEDSKKSGKIDWKSPVLDKVIY